MITSEITGNVIGVAVREQEMLEKGTEHSGSFLSPTPHSKKDLQPTI